MRACLCLSQRACRHFTVQTGSGRKTKERRCAARHTQRETQTSTGFLYCFLFSSTSLPVKQRGEVSRREPSRLLRSHPHTRGGPCFFFGFGIDSRLLLSYTGTEKGKGAFSPAHCRCLFFPMRAGAGVCSHPLFVNGRGGLIFVFREKE